MTIKINRSFLGVFLVIMLIAIAAVGVNAATSLSEPKGNTLSPQNSSSPNSPGIEQSLAEVSNLVILGLNEDSWTDAYNAASALEKSAQQIMNAVFQIRKGSIEDVPFTVDQLNALKDQGLGGMVKGVDRYTDLLGILKVNQTTIDAWEVGNPQSPTCYSTFRASGCPALIIPTPTP